MTLSFLALAELRVGLVFALALASVALLGRAPAAVRRFVLACAFVAALALPLVSALAPSLRLESPIAASLVRARSVAERPIGTETLESAPARPREASAPPTTRPARAFDWRVVVVALWALVFAPLALRLAVGLRHASRLVARSRDAADWDEAIARAHRATGLRARVRVSDDLGAPAVAGLVTPTVLVPASSRGWTEERRYAVLLHELAHVAHRDGWVQLASELACAIHWWNPLAWRALRRLRIERELAADDVVLSAGARASSYAEDLLAIAGELSVGNKASVALLGMAGEPALVRRVVAIVAEDRARGPVSRVSAGVASAAFGAAAIFVACATPSSSPVTEGTISAPRVTSASSTIDPTFQAIAEDELARVLAETGAASGTVLVLEPATGAIVANAGSARGVPTDVAIQKVYVAGSTFKAVPLAGALDDRAVDAGERFDCEHGSRLIAGKRFRDAAENGNLSLPEMLAVSSNVGFSKVFDRLGAGRLDHWLRRFHFDAPPFDGAAVGGLPPRVVDGSFEGARIAIGQDVHATPLQIASVYATFANGGEYVAPTLVRHAPGEAPRERVVREETARAVLAMLAHVVDSERGTGKRARVAGVRVAGKTGTSSWDRAGGGEDSWMSFVGVAPVEAPRFVVFVGVESPRGDESGGTVAAPVFARVVAKLLALLRLGNSS